MSIRDLTLEQLLEVLPNEVREEIGRLRASNESESGACGWQGTLKTPVDKQPPAREVLYQIFNSEEHAREALAFFLRLSALPFADSADLKVKSTVWTAVLAFLSHYIDMHIAHNREIQSMFVQLIAEIENISEGRTVAILKENRLRGRPRAPKQHDVLFGYSAALIDVLVQNGSTEKRAAEVVVRLLEEREWPLPSSTSKSNRSSADRLLDWRAQVRSSRGSAFACLMYGKAKKDISSKLPDEAKRLLIAAMELSSTKV